MWTVTIIKRWFDAPTKQVLVLVRYEKEGQAFDKKHPFPHNVSWDTIQRSLKRELNMLVAGETNINNIPEGVVNLSNVVEDQQPTQSEIDQAEWFRDFNRLERVSRLNDLGGMPAIWQTDFDALKTKVQTNAKKAYINQM